MVLLLPLLQFCGALLLHPNRHLSQFGKQFVLTLLTGNKLPQQFDLHNIAASDSGIVTGVARDINSKHGRNRAVIIRHDEAGFQRDMGRIDSGKAQYSLLLVCGYEFIPLSTGFDFGRPQNRKSPQNLVSFLEKKLNLPFFATSA